MSGPIPPADAVRPLPPRPNLELERKRAKRRLRERRAEHPESTLADAQRDIAREYGFASWPKLVAYYTTWERYERAGPLGLQGPLELYTSGIDRVFRDHAHRRPSAAHALASFVPRFYGQSDDAIFDASMSTYDAQLVVARTYRFSSWQAILDALGSAVDTQPGLIDDVDLATAASLELAHELHTTADRVASLLARGADPTWLPPDGIPILDRALLRYWNAAAVDLIAERVRPRAAFWIAAGLGDVPTMLRFLDRDGRPLPAVHRDRPDLALVGLRTPCRPDADDLELLWEAFLVAGMNGRLAALDALLDRGFPIDHARWGSTLLTFARGNSLTVLAEHLERRGAR